MKKLKKILTMICLAALIIGTPGCGRGHGGGVHWFHWHR
jgi:hypothetical protein